MQNGRASMNNVSFSVWFKNNCFKWSLICIVNIILTYLTTFTNMQYTHEGSTSYSMATHKPPPCVMLQIHFIEESKKSTLIIIMLFTHISP